MKKYSQTLALQYTSIFWHFFPWELFIMVMVVCDVQFLDLWPILDKRESSLHVHLW